MTENRQLFLLLSLALMIVSGCASRTNHQALVAAKAAELGAVPEAVATSQYTLQTLQVMSGKTRTLRIYIEGDGRAWARRSRPSIDPTPASLTVMDLMAADPTKDKAYIARPCQFIMTSQCRISSWTDQRYSQSAVTSVNEVMDALKSKGHYQQLELVGFSGGATLALLTAARRRDIASIRTVAGNLDPAYVNRIHNVSFMPDAISPVKFTRELDDIPQLHLSGANDPIIPPSVFAAYLTWFGKQDCIAGNTLKGVGHHQGWARQWPALLATPLPTCVSTPPPLKQ